MNKEEIITIDMSQKEIKEREKLVKDVITEDLKKFDIDINKEPISVKTYDEFDKHRGRTIFTQVDWTELETGKLIRREITKIEVNFTPFPILECIIGTAHHEASHIVKHIKHRFDEEDEHGDIFQGILKVLNKNVDKEDLCKTCPYIHKTIFLNKVLKKEVVKKQWTASMKVS